MPTHIAAAASEAHICLGAGSPRGAVALARAVVESIAKDKGINKGTPQQKIDELHKRNYISDDMKEAAHEIQFAGNAAAHSDVVAEQLSIEDADEIVSLMDAILQHIYQRRAHMSRASEKSAKSEKPRQKQIKNRREWT